MTTTTAGRLDCGMWPVEVDVLADAEAQARPFKGDKSADDRAWAARVDTAVQGMDVVDPAGLDIWMQAHAESDAPHRDEAELVAIWETHVRDLSDDASELDDAVADWI